MSTEAFTPADLAALLDGEPPGEAEEALAGLLGDEWEEVYPPAAQAELRARLDAAGWPLPFAHCPACQTVFLKRFRPDSGRCRECAALLAPRPRHALAPEKNEEPPITKTWGEAPAEATPNWTLADDRGPRVIAWEEGRDFLEQRSQELLELAARSEAADWLGGGDHDPSDEAPALSAAPRSRSESAPDAEPVAAEAVAAEIVPGEPVAAKSVPGEPVAAEPVAAEPVAAEPVEPEPVAAAPVAEPVEPEPVEPEPVEPEPVEPEPVAAEPALAEPALAEPVEPESVASGPVGVTQGAGSPQRGGPLSDAEAALAGISDATLAESTDPDASLVRVCDSATPTPSRTEAADPSGSAESADLDASSPRRVSRASEAGPAPIASSDPAQTEEADAEAGLNSISLAPDSGSVRTSPDPPGASGSACDAAASAQALQGAAPAELREETGRRAGRVHTLALGSSFRVGTARRGEVVLRQRGVAFKHAELRVAEDGSATLSDLGGGQTWLGDELLAPQEVRNLSSGDVVRCGQAALLVTLHLAEAPADSRGGLAPAVEVAPRAPWKPPSAAEVAAARHTPPSQILAALPASQLDLVARAARAIPLPRWRASQPRPERVFVDHEAEAFAQLARGVLDGRYLPEDSGTWLRWEEEEESFLCRSALEDGATVILAPWDLLARLPEPLPGSGPARVGRFLELLLPRNTGRLVAEEEGELAGGFWRCRYASRAGLCAGRFSSIEARSNGHVLTATLTPRFPLQAQAPSFAEDPHEAALGDLRSRQAWRPPPRGQGAPAPHVPRGGRHRERRLPSRSRSRDHYR